MDRFAGVTRPYTEQDVKRLQGTFDVEYTISKKRSEKLWQLLNTEDYVNTLGSLSGNHAVQHAKAGLKAIYLSGWQVAADAKTTMPSATPAERLEAFLKAGYSDEFLEMSHLRTRIELWSAAMSYPTIAQTERALYDRYRAQLEKLLHQVSDPWKTDRIPMVSDLIMATLDGLWLDWMRRRDPQAVQNGLEACVLFARLRLGGA